MSKAHRITARFVGSRRVSCASRPLTASETAEAEAFAEKRRKQRDSRAAAFADDPRRRVFGLDVIAAHDQATRACIGCDQLQILDTCRRARCRATSSRTYETLIELVRSHSCPLGKHEKG